MTLSTVSSSRSAFSISISRGALSTWRAEIDQWVIDRLEAIGCDTAKSVLAFTPEDIAKRADLEDETVAEVFRILRAEFEE